MSQRLRQLAVACLFLVAAGLFAQSVSAAPDNPYYPPAGEWAHKKPAEVGMDAAKLAEAVSFMMSQEQIERAIFRIRKSCLESCWAQFQPNELPRTGSLFATATSWANWGHDAPGSNLQRRQKHALHGCRHRAAARPHLQLGRSCGQRHQRWRLRNAPQPAGHLAKSPSAGIRMGR